MQHPSPGQAPQATSCTDDQPHTWGLPTLPGHHHPPSLGTPGTPHHCSCCCCKGGLAVVCLCGWSPLCAPLVQSSPGCIQSHQLCVPRSVGPGFRASPSLSMSCQAVQSGEPAACGRALPTRARYCLSLLSAALCRATSSAASSVLAALITLSTQRPPLSASSHAVIGSSRALPFPAWLPVRLSRPPWLRSP